MTPTVRRSPPRYWLTCGAAIKAIARLESGGAIGELNARYDDDPAFGAAVDAAHAEAAEDRGRRAAEAAAWGGVGGTRAGIKCLHAHYANRLGGGDDPVGAWVAERIEPVHAAQGGGRVAVVDQGTNSCRLLVVEPAGDPAAPPVELARDMVITRLGQGVDASGLLHPEALARTQAVLARYCRRARALGAQRIRVAATSAVREAANAATFASMVRDLAGSDLEVIDGRHEAALSFLGATRGLDPRVAPFVALDIGGGSTELAFGRGAGRPDASLSTRMGSVRLRERLLRHDPPSREDLAALEAAIDAMLDEVEVAVPVREAHTCISVGGTPTTLQAIALDLPRYDPDRIHRTWLSLEDAEAVLRRLQLMDDAERAALPVMAPGRGDVIVVGGAILRGGAPPVRVRADARFGDRHPGRARPGAAGRRVTCPPDAQPRPRQAAREAPRAAEVGAGGGRAAPPDPRVGRRRPRRCPRDRDRVLGPEGGRGQRVALVDPVRDGRERTDRHQRRDRLDRHVRGPHADRPGDARGRGARSRRMRRTGARSRGCAQAAVRPRALAEGDARQGLRLHRGGEDQLRELRVPAALR